jgi:hypothetical protein
MSLGMVEGSRAWAQAVTNSKLGQPDKFRQLEEVLPTPNTYRTASGAPGHEYWQQKVDYDIDVELDDEKQRIIEDARPHTPKNHEPVEPVPLPSIATPKATAGDNGQPATTNPTTTPTPQPLPGRGKVRQPGQPAPPKVE